VDVITLIFMMNSANVKYRFTSAKRLYLAVIVAWAIFSVASTSAQQPAPSEDQVKAAYLYNFGRFVKWPPNAVEDRDRAFVICVFSQDPFGLVLESTLAGQLLNGKPVVIRRVMKPQEAAHCHILFIDATQGPHLREILAGIDQSSVLTVSDMPHFLKQGGMIQFVLQEDKVRFEVDLNNVGSGQLALSSELLKVAAMVRGNTRPGGP
jgi:hypothetical protein